MNIHRIIPSQAATRRLSLVALSAAALFMAGCSSNVKLDDEASNAPAPISSANMPSSGSSSGTNGSGMSATPVAPVVAAPDASTVDDASLARVIYFDYDSNVVKEEFRDAIDGHAKRLSAAKSKKVIIEGHTDERGGREYNLALGQRRAEAVQKSLTLLGVSADQVEAVSLGEERPAAQGAGEEVWAQNRRAEIKDR